MREVVELLVKGLVDNPDQVQVTEGHSDSPDVIRIEVSVAEEDTGRVIGRQGRIANAIRTVARAAAARENKKAFVDILS